MTDAELLTKVKEGLGLSNFNDNVLFPKVLAAKGYMVGAGITTELLESDLGIAALTVGTNDLWNLAPGEVKFSEAFNIILTQLACRSLPEVVPGV